MKSIFFATSIIMANFVYAEINTIDANKETAAIVLVKQAGGVTELDPSNFTAFLNNATQPVVVEFYSPRCPPCRAIKSVYAQIANEETGITFATINIENGQADTIMTRYNVQATPTFLIFKANKTYGGMIEGGMQKNLLVAKIKSFLQK